MSNVNKKCAVYGCPNVVGAHGAHGMCPKHYNKSRITVKTCSQCGERKNFYNGSSVCQACQWFSRTHAGARRTAPLRIRDNVKKNNASEYSIYRGMKKRCSSKNAARYKNYGGRGIKVCDRWLGPDGFHHFLADMGPRPDDSYSIDRIDPNGNYEPDNCRWADKWTQAANTTKKRLYSRKVGVTFNKSIGLWVATLQKDNKRYVRYAKTEPEAIRLRLKLEKEQID